MHSCDEILLFTIPFNSSVFERNESTHFSLYSGCHLHVLRTDPRSGFTLFVTLLLDLTLNSTWSGA